jgi:Ca2+-binding EF-hand superfamily protein
MGGKSTKSKDPKTKSPVTEKKNGGSKKGDVKKVSVLKDEEINLLTANTNFNRDEIISIHKDFVKDCPSGRIDKKDFGKLFKSLHPLDNKKSKIDKYCVFAFNAFDKNHDGFIDFNEFCVAFSVTSSGDLRQKVQFAFRHFDSDRDEKINKNDLLNVISSNFFFCWTGLVS